MINERKNIKEPNEWEDFDEACEKMYLIFVKEANEMPPSEEKNKLLKIIAEYEAI